MDAVSFPILRLPQSALKNALRQMCLMEHLFLSVLSTKAKQHITMFNEVQQDVSLIVRSSEFIFTLQSKKNYYDLHINFKLSNVKISKLFFPGHVFTTISVPEFTAKQWIDHIGSVFLKNASLALLVQNPEKRMLEERYEYIEEFRIVNLEIHSAEIQDIPLYEMFPLLKCLSFVNVPKSKSILIQNLEELQFNVSKVTLNEIVLVNCSTITIDNQVISDKNLNLFIKHWIKGSNCQLKSFEYHIRPTERLRFVEVSLFEGIGYMEKEEDDHWKRFEIKRNDGTKATVLLSKTDYISFVMCVSPVVLTDLPAFKIYQ
ncbi:F-box associated domain-containing protein [Caenorhabditis elegans]|uniref:F-box associated domain-containing protein n=1 Tax=Caenorhabditis elegans TaxID=6239 RepID=P91449_CAEEL|nr:F-box associated domain-containing protein [Caenorhabditis elegans]CCD68951.2 F-box associated domain-containing protein [Caenorhabditis elegans]|eukprot:NP_494178.2 F-box B protein [Caenorhabditis elegans]